MTWPTEKIASWEHYEAIVHRRRPKNGRNYLFRGQSRAKWKDLRPRLARTRKSATELIQHEIEFLDSIPGNVPVQRREILYELELGLVEWWAILQHHREPTRLLDWTRDPYVALYFAIESHTGEDGAVWFVHPATVLDAMEAEFETRGAPEPPGDFYTDPAAPDHVFFGWPYRETARAAAQKGEFSWCRRPDSRHDTIIERCMWARPDRKNRHRKLIIPAHLKQPFLTRLQPMGVANEDALFPGEEGLRGAIVAAVEAALRHQQGR